MRWRLPQKPEIAYEKTRSKKVFAWLPVITNDHYRVWFGFYEQHYIWKYSWVKTTKWAKFNRFR